MTLNVSGEDYNFSGKDAPQITMAIESAVMALMASKMMGKSPKPSTRQGGGAGKTAGSEEPQKWCKGCKAMFTPGAHSRY